MTSFDKKLAQRGVVELVGDGIALGGQKKRSLFLPDQDILSGLYGEKVKLADAMRFNLCEKILALYNAGHRHGEIDLGWIRQNCAVIHYCGKRKPWNDDYIRILDVFYKEIMAGTQK